jgi:hypothetical protein
MTVKLSDRDGSETVVRLSMQSVIALSTIFAMGIISGIIVWVYGIQCNVTTLQSKAAVFEQVDQTQKEMLISVDGKIDKLDGKLERVLSDQERRRRIGK